MFKPCILVPIFNHGSQFQKAFQILKDFPYPILLIDDGSDESTRVILEKILEQRENVILKRRKTNGGKGAAVKSGLELAYEMGFTHALQVDADLQHNLDDIPEFLKISSNHLDSLILGSPIFDKSIPASRLNGRKFTNLWVSIETLSGEIDDAMCGFRVYPLEATIQVLQTVASLRMGFDIEILVKLYWYGLKVINLPTRVVYPLDGISNFRLWEDNLEITLTHTRLFFGMLVRLPTLLLRKIRAFSFT